jgi:selenocysteine lyase/cysteine desulfurase
VHRTAWGYHSTDDLATHFLPTDAPGPEPLTWTAGTDAAATFEVGSRATAALLAFSASLPYLRELGVERIQAWRQPLLDSLRERLTGLGFTPLTPEGSRSPIIAFSFPPDRAVGAQLRRARVNARVGRGYLRLSPSVFNAQDDVDGLVDALK